MVQLPANTGNYVTGLDNKSWSIDNPTIASGRAATEDQLKTVSDEVKKQKVPVQQTSVPLRILRQAPMVTIL